MACHAKRRRPRGGNQAVAESRGAECSVQLSTVSTTQAAAEGGHRRIVEILMKEQADANSPPGAGRGQTALTAAAAGGHADIVRILLKAKAHVDSNVVEEYGHSCLGTVAGEGELGLVEMWLNGFLPVKKSGLTPVEAAVQNRQAEVVDLLLKEGARVTISPMARGQTTFISKMMGRAGRFIIEDRSAVRFVEPPL